MYYDLLYMSNSSNSAKALLIGINYINTPTHQLKGCVNDIITVKDMLINAYNYDPTNIVMLYDDSSNLVSDNILEPNPISSLNYGLPTANHILMRLKDIVDSSNRCSEIWIHYSGHGTRIVDLSGDSTDLSGNSTDLSVNSTDLSGNSTDLSSNKYDECIVPCDSNTAGIITDDMIFNIIKDIKCKAILIFDCCHSSSICDLEWSFTNDSGLITRTQINNRTIINPNIYMFSGCKDNQVSLDMYNTTKNEFYGVMTNSFIACLQSNNYTCSIQKLYLDICAYIKTNNPNSSQQPGFSSSYLIPSYYFIKSDAPISILNAIRAKTKIQKIQNNIRSNTTTTGISQQMVGKTSINPALLLPKNLQLQYAKKVIKPQFMHLR